MPIIELGTKCLQEEHLEMNSKQGRSVNWIQEAIQQNGIRLRQKQSSIYRLQQGFQNCVRKLSAPEEEKESLLSLLDTYFQNERETTSREERTWNLILRSLEKDRNLKQNLVNQP